jgi:hypothetical protein
LSTPRARKLRREESQPQETNIVIKEIPNDEPKLAEPLKPETKPSDTITVKVLVGTLGWAKGTFQKDETFTCTREELKRFDPKDIQVIA